MKRLKYISFMILILSILISGCGQTDNSKGSNDITENNNVKHEEKKPIVPTKGGTLKIALNNPKTLNPILNNDESVDMMLKLIYDTLIIFDDQEKPAPNIAKSWKFSDDGTILTLNIRDDVKWHDGKPLTAEDVIFTLKTLKAAPANTMYKKCIENVSYFKLLDKYNLKIVFKQPFSAALYTLYFPIIPKHHYTSKDILTDPNNKKPLGSGVYKFENYIPMKEINLKSNEQWFKGTPYIENIHGIITRNDEAKIDSFEQKQIDVVYTKNIDWGKYSDNEKINVNEFTTNYYNFIGFNFEKDLCKNKNIRQAVAYSINREKIISDFLLGHGILTDVPINPNSWLNKKNKIIYNYNTEKAKQLLKKSGWTDSNSDGILDNTINGVNKNLTLSLLVNKDNTLNVDIANNIKKDLSNLGIVLNINEVDGTVFMQNLKEGNYDLFLGGWKLSPIVDLTFAFHSSMINNGTNYIKYNNPKMDDLLFTAFTAKGDEKMKDAYDALISYTENELPYISLFFRTNAVVTGSNVYGDFKPNSHNIYNSIEKWFIH